MAIITKTGKELLETDHYVGAFLEGFEVDAETQLLSRAPLRAFIQKIEREAIDIGIKMGADQYPLIEAADDVGT